MKYGLLTLTLFIFSCNTNQKEPAPLEIYDFTGIEPFLNRDDSKTYVVNFWATWCLPCKKELPDLNLLSLKLKKYKINVITVSIDKKNIKDQLLFLKNNGASHLSSFFDKKMNLYNALKLRGIPTTILVNKSGFIVSKHEGVLKWGKDKIVKNILNLIN